MAQDFSIQIEKKTLTWKQSDVENKLTGIGELSEAGKLKGRKVIIHKDLSVESLSKWKQLLWGLASHFNWTRKLFNVDYAQSKSIFEQIEKQLVKSSDANLIQLFNQAVSKYNKIQKNTPASPISEEKSAPPTPPPGTNGSQGQDKSDLLVQALATVAHIPKPTVLTTLPIDAALPDFSKPLGALSKPIKVSDSEIHTTFGQTKIILKKGSAVYEETDAVVNAANSNILGGGGIDGAFWAASEIKNAPGQEKRKFLESEILPIKKTLPKGKLPTGGAVITRSLNIPSPYIIHAVGPQNETPTDLRNAYLSSIKLLLANNLKSISFCCISQSIYGYSPTKAAPIVVDLLRRYCEENPGALKEIRLMMFDEKKEWDVYSALPEFKIS